MEVNEQLVRAVTQAVVVQLMASGAQPQNVSSTCLLYTSDAADEL